MRLILLAALALLSGIAQAAGPVAHVTIVHATQQTVTDPITGQKSTIPLPLSDIQKVVVKWSVGTTLAGSVDLIAPATTIDVPGLICGDYSFTAYTVLKTAVVSPDYVPPAIYATGVSCTAPKSPAVTVQ